MPASSYAFQIISQGAVPDRRFEDAFDQATRMLHSPPVRIQRGRSRVNEWPDA